jgi:hypothetical protein
MSFVRGKLRPDVYPADVPFAELLDLWLRKDPYRSARVDAKKALWA